MSGDKMNYLSAPIYTAAMDFMVRQDVIKYSYGWEQSPFGYVSLKPKTRPISLRQDYLYFQYRSWSMGTT